MKKFLVLFFSVMLFCISCEEEKVVPTNDSEQKNQAQTQNEDVAVISENGDDSYVEGDDVTAQNVVDYINKLPANEVGEIPLTGTINNSTLTNIKNALDGRSGLLVDLDLSQTTGAFECGDEIFKGCTALKKVTVGGALPSVVSGMFSGCSNLETVVLKSTLTGLDPKAFTGCSKLNSVTMETATGKSWKGMNENFQPQIMEVDNPTTNATNLKEGGAWYSYGSISQIQ